MDLLAENLMQVTVRGCEIRVPSPEAYIFHKLLIQRQTEEKAQKDLRAVENLLEYMRRHPSRSNGLHTLFDKLTKRQQRRIAERCEENRIEVWNN